LIGSVSGRQREKREKVIDKSLYSARINEATKMEGRDRSTIERNHQHDIASSMSH